MVGIVVENLVAGYGNVSVLHDVSIDVADKQTVALLGTNGNGKSTLLSCIAGLIKPTEGHIFLVDGEERIDLTSLSPKEIVEAGVSMVPEGRRLFPLLTVEENLVLGAYRLEARAVRNITMDYCFTLFPRLAERRSQQAGSMSGGEQQMLSVARALMGVPKLLLIDEPSVGLAPILVQQMIEKIGELSTSKGLTVLMAEQNFNQAIRIADKGYIIVHGEIAFASKDAVDLRENEMIKSYYLGG
ncbi:MAG: ABC transporter ATP-binding protein [Alphaproteobacteria bacterium]|jgi:branched-chain amino acid transport system ATP-binding protein|nr:ABC transporter ATP-binding protein [Alphaproteobacteria bacterium]